MHALHGEPLDGHPEDGPRLRLGLAGVLRELDAAGLPAPAGVDLRLDDDGAPDLGGRRAAPRPRRTTTSYRGIATP